MIWLGTISADRAKKSRRSPPLHLQLRPGHPLTPGKVPESREFVKLVDPQARDVTADQGYDTNANHRRLQATGQRSSIITKRKRTNPAVLGQADPRRPSERPNIERKFAEQKRYHGLRQVRYWGLAKVTLQVLMTCLVVNCKRMARLLEASGGPPRAAWCPAAGRGR